jgi:hypothetical protein
MMVILMFGLSDARKKDKSGNIKEGTFTDKKYNYAFDIPDAWDTSIKKNKSNTRIILMRKEYEVPIHFQHYPAYTTIPKITIYADTTSLDINRFVDSILADKYKSKQKKNILEGFKLLFGDFVLKKRGKMKAGDLSGIRIAGNQRYTIQVQQQGMDADKADVVTEFYGGSIYFIKQGDIIIMFHFICENLYFDAMEKEFIDIVKTFKFVEG